MPIKHLSLGGANLKIKAALKSYLLSQSQKQFLNTIKNRIDAIHTVERGWLKIERCKDEFNRIQSDVKIQDLEIQDLEKFYKQVSYHGLVNENELLIKQMLETQKKIKGFTFITTNVLLNDIKSELIKSQPFSKYLAILLHLQLCFETIINQLKSDITFTVKEITNELDETATKKKILHEISAVNLNFEESILFSVYYAEIYNAFSVQQVFSLGGRFLPFNQGDDPLAGKLLKDNKISDFDGLCWGYVSKWCEEIEKTGVAYNIPQANDSTIHSQEKQTRNFFNTTFNFKTDIRPLIDQLIDSISLDKIYQLNLSWKTSGHAMGLRRIPSSNEVEFFDPNNGLFVFNDVNIFKPWLANYLSCLFAKNLIKGGVFELIKKGKQPSNAKPSIVNLNNNYFDSNVLHTLNTQGKFSAETAFYAQGRKLPQSNQFFKKIFKRSNNKISDDSAPNKAPILKNK